MALAFIIDGGLNDAPGTGTELYEAWPAVRDAYAEAARCAGLHVERMLAWELDRSGEHRQVGALRQAALALGVCDVLAGHGIGPDVVAGLSLGGMVGAALAGAITRRELFELLAHLRGVPDPPGPPQGVASYFVPKGREPDEFAGGFPDGVYVAADMGLVGDRSVRMLLLSGYRAALHRLAEQLGDPTVLRIPPNITTAYHSPLQHYITDFLEPVVARTAFRKPHTPLCGGLSPFQYDTGEQVRSMFLRNHTETVSLPRLLDCLDRHDTELSFVIGPSMGDLFVAAAEHTVIRIENPEHLAEALDAFHESGLAARPARC